MLKDVLKNMALHLFNNLLKIFLKFFSYNRLLIEIFKILEKQGIFLTFHSRENFDNRIKVISKEQLEFENFGIVVQGPIQKSNDFTLETIKLYKRTFPKSTIVLSTWDDEDDEYLRKFPSDVVILRNAKPKICGIWNVNYQIESTKNGLKVLKENNIEYSLKTRTDQRMYAEGIASYLMTILKVFPVKDNSQQEARIVTINMNTYKFRPYSVSDIFLFSKTSELLKYWDIELDNRVLSQEKIMSNSKTFGELMELKFPEMYILEKYLEKLDIRLKKTLEDYYGILRDFFVVINKEDIDLYWDKYDKYFEYRKRKYSEKNYLEEFDFKDWLGLFNNGRIPNCEEEFIKKREAENLRE